MSKLSIYEQNIYNTFLKVSREGKGFRYRKNFDNIVLYLDFLNKLTEDWVIITANYFSKTVTVNALKQSVVSY